MTRFAGRGVDRRTVLELAGLVGLGVTSGLSGCLGAEPPSAAAKPALGPSDTVPDSAEAVIYTNLGAVFTDQGLRNGIDEQIGTFQEQIEGSEGPSTLDEYLDDIEADTGIDLRGVTDGLGFWNPGMEDGAVVLSTAWSPETITDQMSGYSAESYRGRTLYAPPSGGPVAVLSDGVYAVGSDAAVRSVVDVRDGQADSLSGGLRDAYDGTRGMARFAVAVPDRSVAELTGIEASDGAGSVYLQAANTLVESVQYATASMYRDGSDRALRVSLLTPSADDARQVANLLQSGRDLLLDQLAAVRTRSALGDVQRMVYDRLGTFGLETRISRDGSTVRLTYADSPSEFVRNSPLLLLGGVFVNTAGSVQSTAGE